MDVKKVILTAFAEIIQKTSFDKITTQMILDKSTISRSTFYRHFRDKYDVMTWHYQNYVNELINKYEFRDFYCFVRDNTEFVRQNRAYYERAIETTGENSFFPFLSQYTMDYYVSVLKSELNVNQLSSKEKYQLTIIIEGCNAAFRQYVKNGCKESPEDMAKWIVEVLPQSLRDILN